MPKISLAIAVFNEEENIIRCLDSVAGLVSEVVAVDGSSTDGTVRILRKYKARITVADNPANFHINKNKAIDNCRGDWILQLDADEIVSDELKKEIITAVKSPAVNGYWMPRKNYFLGRFLTKGGQYPDYTLRLYRRGMGRLPAGSVHEQAVVKGKTGYLKNPLLHFPYPDFKHYLDHFTRYTDIFATQLRHDKVPVNLSAGINYLMLKPLFWFLKTFFRHKGFYDGWPGFVFSFFSALRFPVSYIKYLKGTS